MKPVAPPDIDGVAHLGEIIASKEKHRALLDGLRSRITVRYERFLHEQRYLRCAAKKMAWTKDEKEALYHLWSPTNALDKMLAEIREESAGICPYCGVSPSNSWDHILPKDKAIFPEFCVLPQNLIWTCLTCNNLRGTAWEETLLPYWDDYGEGAVVRCVLSLSRFPSVDFKPKDEMGQTAFFKLFWRHFRKLRLGANWKTVAEKELRAALSEQRSWQNMGLEPCALLEVRRKTSLEQEGANHWRTSLFQALVDEQESVVAFLEAYEP